MYKQFFGLKENPFNVTPDPRFLYLTLHAEEALACLRYCVQARKGFVMLTGDVGTGKTTLLNKLLEWLHEEKVASAFVFNPRLNPFQFLDYALSDFGINCTSRLKSAILSELNQWLLERYKEGSTATLIVDEAQDASPELLEEIRLLANLETPSGKLLQIVLAGQQELEMKLRTPEYRQLRQRISLRCRTYPLTREEIHEYVATRLRIGGSDGRQIFSPSAIDALHFYSEGIPRVINILCEDALVSAFADRKSMIAKEIIDTVAKELELDVYPATAPAPPEQQLGYLPRREPLLPLSAGSELHEEPRARQKPPTLAPAPWAPPPFEPPRAVENIAPDDNVFETLKTQESPAKPQPFQPIARPPQPPARPFVIPPAPKAERIQFQGWMVWAAIAVFVVVGLAGYMLIMNRNPIAESLARVAPSEETANFDGETSPLSATPNSQSPSVVPSRAPSARGETSATKSSIPTPRRRKADEAGEVIATTRPRQATASPMAHADPETLQAVSTPVGPRAGSLAVGGLIVTANVEGASVTLDGQTSPDWITPQAFSRLPAGPHRIVVSKPGYDDVSSEVIVREGRSAHFQAQMSATGGDINILTNPSGLGVSIDGGPFRPSPIQATVGVGSHTYRIKLPNARIYEGSFEMKTGATITRRVDFSVGEWLSPAEPQ